ncbi:alpha/beta fold hydrolase [Leptospira sp. GIMC2001]|uniref:alpha/beta fold hydrolase n=1 Tax=Leptospira sp. GIMC2001 TaxID=1513297 RepID=UPI002349BC67|nr:alpha/beta hydrolase [Leptospira sp. GIMC2001]WCL47585.1 alpha/beta hydrolase [Leptospira sp. GIMC2001]
MFRNFKYIKNRIYKYVEVYKIFRIFLIISIFSIVNNCRFTSCSHESSEDFQSKFKAQGLIANQSILKIQSQIDSSKVANLRFITVNAISQYHPNSRKYVVFIHGSPGGWSDYLNILNNPEINQDFNLISVDRPGYGGSDRGIAILSLKEQADRIAALIASFRDRKKVILVGHSFGGPVAARLAMDHPNLVDGLVFVAASISPDLEKKEWFNSLAEYKIIQFLLPIDLITSNKEIIELKNELTSMLPLWNKIKVPVAFLHGGEDSLVPIDNVRFGKSMLDHNNDNLIVETDPNWNHFLPWNQHGRIIELIYKLDQKIPD